MSWENTLSLMWSGKKWKIILGILDCGDMRLPIIKGKTKLMMTKIQSIYFCQSVYKRTDKVNCKDDTYWKMTRRKCKCNAEEFKIVWLVFKAGIAKVQINCKGNIKYSFRFCKSWNRKYERYRVIAIIKMCWAPSDFRACSMLRNTKKSFSKPVRLFNKCLVTNCCFKMKEHLVYFHKCFYFQSSMFL